MNELLEDPYLYFNSSPLTDSLVNNWQTIRDEFYTLLSTEFNYNAVFNKINPQVKHDPNGENHILYNGRFNSVPVYLKRELLDRYEAKDWPEDRKEVMYDARLKHLPFLTNFINEYKHIMGATTFNISFPGSLLSHHFGLSPDYLRLHLCLKEDHNCIFDIENWRHTWKEGELFAFDDAHVLHGTKHYSTDSSTNRIILLIDIKKDYLKQYAKSWPSRTEKPERFPIPNLRGWVENSVNLGTNVFVNEWPKNIKPLEVK